MSDDWRTLRLRRAGTCIRCGAELASGTTAEWSRSAAAVRCASHADAAATIADLSSPGVNPPPRNGIAGRSAQAEYERRKAGHERRVRDTHPLLGGLVLALSGEPQHVTAWRRGASGERAVARRLDPLMDRGVEVLHDRRIPGTRANIDHMAVSSSGVYVVDAKNYTGTVRVDWEGGLFSLRRYKLLVGRRDATKLVAGVQHQVQLVRDALASDPQLPDDVAVTGVLAFFRADWPLFPPDRIDDVRLGGATSAATLIARAGSYAPGVVAVIAERLHTRFPEA